MILLPGSRRISFASARMIIQPVCLQCLFILGLDWIEGKNAPTFIWLSVLLMLFGALVAAYNDLEGEIQPSTRLCVPLMEKAVPNSKSVREVADAQCGTTMTSVTSLAREAEPHRPKKTDFFATPCASGCRDANRIRAGVGQLHRIGPVPQGGWEGQASDGNERSRDTLLHKHAVHTDGLGLHVCHGGEGAVVSFRTCFRFGVPGTCVSAPLMVYGIRIHKGLHRHLGFQVRDNLRGVRMMPRDRQA